MAPKGIRQLQRRGPQVLRQHRPDSLPGDRATPQPFALKTEIYKRPTISKYPQVDSSVPNQPLVQDHRQHHVRPAEELPKPLHAIYLLQKRLALQRSPEQLVRKPEVAEQLCQIPLLRKRPLQLQALPERENVVESGRAVQDHRDLGLQTSVEPAQF